MTTQIEILDEKRRKYRGRHVMGLVIFSVAWIMYAILSISELEMEFLRTLVLAVLILSVFFQAYFALKINLLEREIKKDPFLKEALNNELVRLNELKAWRVSFFSVIGFIILAAILSLFITFNDLMLIFITALLIGFGTYNTAVYLLNR